MGFGRPPEDSSRGKYDELDRMVPVRKVTEYPIEDPEPRTQRFDRLSGEWVPYDSQPATRKFTVDPRQTLPWDLPQDEPRREHVPTPRDDYRQEPRQPRQSSGWFGRALGWMLSRLRSGLIGGLSMSFFSFLSFAIYVSVRVASIDLAGRAAQEAVDQGNGAAAKIGLADPFGMPQGLQNLEFGLWGPHTIPAVVALGLPILFLFIKGRPLAAVFYLGGLVLWAVAWNALQSTDPFGWGLMAPMVEVNPTTLYGYLRNPAG